MPFDIGFIELCVILVVSLIVLGPDKLPVAARTLSRIFRTISRTTSSFRREVDRELQMDELRRQMQEQQERLASVVGKAKNMDVNDIHSGDAKQAGSEVKSTPSSSPESVPSGSRQAES